MSEVVSPATKSGSWRRDIGGTVGIKLVSLPLSALVGLVSLRAVSENYGPSGLAIYGLVLSIPLLLPFADLGIGGSVAELTSVRKTMDRSRYRAEVGRAALTLAIVAALLIGVVAILYFTDVLNVLLGASSQQAALAGFIVLSLFGVSTPLSLGYRVLLGLQMNWVVVLLQSLSGLVGSAMVLLMAGRIGLAPLIALPAVAGALFAAAACLCAHARLQRDDWEQSDQPVNELRGETSRRSALVRLAGPMLLISVSVPAIFQAHRIVLSHLGTTTELAAYTTAVQLYLPANALLTAAGQTLWPRFSGERSVRGGYDRSSIAKACLAFFGVGILAALTIVGAGPLISSWVSPDASASVALFVAFGLLLAVNSGSYPLGMALMGGDSVWFQARAAAVTAVICIVLMIFLARPFGGTGVVLATVASVLICSSLPCAWKIFRWRDDVIKAEA